MVSDHMSEPLWPNDLEFTPLTATSSNKKMIFITIKSMELSRKEVFWRDDIKTTYVLQQTIKACGIDLLAWKSGLKIDNDWLFLLTKCLINGIILYNIHP